MDHDDEIWKRTSDARPKKRNCFPIDTLAYVPWLVWICVANFCNETTAILQSWLRQIKVSFFIPPFFLWPLIARKWWLEYTTFKKAMQWHSLQWDKKIFDTSKTRFPLYKVNLSIDTFTTSVYFACSGVLYRKWEHDYTSLLIGMNKEEQVFHSPGFVWMLIII